MHISHYSFTLILQQHFLCCYYDNINHPGLKLKVEDNDENPSFHQSY